MNELLKTQLDFEMICYSLTTTKYLPTLTRFHLEWIFFMEPRQVGSIVLLILIKTFKLASCNI